jgi:hypothetical protein
MKQHPVSITAMPIFPQPGDLGGERTSASTPLIDQLLSNSATACPIGYHVELEAAIASSDAARISECAEEIVQETCPRQLWVLVAHLMYRCAAANKKEAAHG